MAPDRPGLGDFDIFSATDETPAQPAPSPPTQPTVEPPRSTIHQIVDQQMGGGLAVAAFLHPANWQARSQVLWDMSKQSFPLRVFASASDPVTGDWVEFLPAEAFYWIEPNFGFGRQGQEDGGMFLMPPMSVADAMTKWILPRYRGPGVSNLRVIQIQSINPQRLRYPGSAPMQGAVQEGVCVRIEYLANGRPLEEELYGLKTANPGIPTYGPAGTLVQYNWGFERIFGFGGAKGRLESSRATATAIINSVRVNPQWEHFYASVIQQITNQFNQNMAAGYANIAAAGQLSRQISANNDALLHQMEQQRHAANVADQQHRHAALAAQNSTYTTSDAWSDTMMGRDTYDDPFFANGSQHEHHDEVWTDGQGNYEYRDNGGQDPNVGSTKSWTLLHKREING